MRERKNIQQMHLKSFQNHHVFYLSIIYLDIIISINKIINIFTKDVIHCRKYKKAPIYKTTI